MRRVLVAILVILLSSAGVVRAAQSSPWAALADPVFMRIDMRGLPHPSAYAVAQDSAGFMWIGTLSGLGRYDGYRFQNFLPNSNDPKALPEGWIRTMISDPSGAMWIGTSSSGLVRFDQATQTFRTWRPNQPGNKGPRSANVVALGRSQDGRIWVGGDGGLDRFDPRSNAFEYLDLEPHGRAQPRVEALLIDHERTLWVATMSGVYYRDAGSREFRRFGIATPTFCLYEDDANHLWIGATNQLFVLSPHRRLETTITSSADPATLADGEQWAVAQIGPNTVLAGTQDTGLSIVDLANKTVRRVKIDSMNFSRSPGPVWQIFRDRSGLLWIAGGSGGLATFDPASHGVYNLSGNDPYLQLGDTGVQSMTGGNHGELWIGGAQGQIRLLDPKAGVAKQWVLPSHLAVIGVTQVSDDALWIGTTTGVCSFEIHREAFVCPAGPKAFVDRRVGGGIVDGGTIWMTTTAGVVGVKHDGNVVSFRQGSGPHALSNDTITALYADREHRIWAGTDNGVDLIDPHADRVQPFLFDQNDNDSLGAGEMTSILEDRRGNVWVGSLDGPVNLFTKNDKSFSIRRIDEVNGVPYQNVTNLAEDSQGRIWASTTNSIVVIDPEAKYAGALGWADGIPYETFYAPGAEAQMPDGSIVFGGRHGLTVVTPGALPRWRAAAPPLIASLKLGNRQVPAWELNRGLGDVELPANRRDIAVEFASLEFPTSQSVRYAYKLDGYDKQWIDADPEYRVASYTNLPPGRYTLRARATNKLGQWSPRELALAVRADYAWYETWWFRLLAAALIALGAYGFYKLRTAVLHRQQRALESVVATRTQELAWANEQLSQANVRLEDMSVTEPLTGLRNRRFLIQHVEADVSIAQRRYEDWIADGAAGDAPEAADLLFFIADIDHFKAFNDRYGHHAGDMILMQMRERFAEVFRESDFVVRWGGEEFLAVARGSRRADAPTIGERVRQAVGSRPFSIEGGAQVDVTVSIGFAAFPLVAAAPRTASWGQVIGIADRALYMAKESGRNACFGLVAAPGADAERLGAELERSVDDAIRGGDLEAVRPVRVLT